MPADPTRSQVRISLVMSALTVSAGAVDAVTFLGLGHAFAALATGNVLLLGFGAAQTAGIPVARPAEAVASFVIGAAAANTVIARASGRGRRWLVLVLAAEAAALAAAGGYATAVGGTGALPGGAEALVAALVAGAMGWRSRGMLEAGVPEMPTTVAQITLVKLLADVLSIHTAPSPRLVLVRARRSATVLGMFVGGALGALLLRSGAGPALLAVAAFEACVTAVYFRATRFRPQPVRA
ncbi:YoaK family protein [Kitasatospora sp. NPDC101176]|uniref:YoaK family protein n=1 Tax=Kitasatospora sp. NPDC101176 TaxID=3364099 RepID=UPI003828F833